MTCGRIERRSCHLMVPGEGFEPPTFGLQNRCTATVLTRLALRRYLLESERSTPSHDGLTASLNSLSSGPELLRCEVLLAG
jgi:hypothetical protein